MNTLSRTYIGDLLKQRMKALGIEIDKLSNDSLVDKKIIEDLLINKISYEEIDQLDIDFIAQCLYCTSEYFIDEKVREKDIVYASIKQGHNHIEENLVKGKIQQMGADFEFIRCIAEKNNLNKN